MSLIFINNRICTDGTRDILLPQQHWKCCLKISQRRETSLNEKSQNFPVLRLFFFFVAPGERTADGNKGEELKAKADFERLPTKTRPLGAHRISLKGQLCNQTGRAAHQRGRTGDYASRARTESHQTRRVCIIRGTDNAMGSALRHIQSAKPTVVLSTIGLVATASRVNLPNAD